jgi:hypothetical protein
MDEAKDCDSDQNGELEEAFQGAENGGKASW